MALPLMWAAGGDHVVGTQDDGHIDLAEFAIDVFHLEHLVVGHFGSRFLASTHSFPALGDGHVLIRNRLTMRI